MTPEQEVQRYITTGEHDPLHAAWPGRNLLERLGLGMDGNASSGGVVRIGELTSYFAFLSEARPFSVSRYFC